jgi:hypothetical protein
MNSLATPSWDGLVLLDELAHVWTQAWSPVSHPECGV